MTYIYGIRQYNIIKLHVTLSVKFLLTVFKLKTIFNYRFFVWILCYFLLLGGNKLFGNIFFYA